MANVTNMWSAAAGTAAAPQFRQVVFVDLGGGRDNSGKARFDVARRFASQRRMRS
jgi:hypothetical protein